MSSLQEAESGTLPRGVGPSRTAVGLGLAALLLALVPLVHSEALLAQATQTLLFVLFVVSLNLLVGYGGMISMGHASLLAAGGYVAAILSRDFGFGMAIAGPLGILAAGALAAAMGIFAVRLTHSYFIMLTLAFAQLVYVVLWKWREVTGGDDGLIGFAPPPVLRDGTAYYLFTLAIVAVSVAALHRLTRSPFGVALVAIRDNPRRAAFAGINVRAVQFVAFIIAGLFAGLAGVLQAFFQRGIFVDSAHFLNSADALTACVLGGVRLFVGPIVGAVLFRGISIVVPQVTPYWMSVLGVIILIVALVIPDGLTSLIHKRRRRG